MHRNLILGLLLLLAVAGGVSLLLIDPEDQVIQAVNTDDLIPDISPTSIDSVEVLSEAAVSLEPDIDLHGEPVEDHFETTTTSTTERASTSTTEPASTTTTGAKKGTSPSSTTSSTQPPETSPPPTTVEAHFDSGAESSFAKKINGLRSSNGLSSLSRSGSLNSEARAWAKHIGQAGSLSHSGISRLIPPWDAAAENVGTGGSVSSVFDALAGSGGHRGNMLGDYTHFGIGVWVDSNGRLWTVHVFAR